MGLLFAAFKFRALSCIGYDGRGHLSGKGTPVHLSSRRWAGVRGALVSLAVRFATGGAPKFQRLLELEKFLIAYSVVREIWLRAKLCSDCVGRSSRVRLSSEVLLVRAEFTADAPT